MPVASPEFAASYMEIKSNNDTFDLISYLIYMIEPSHDEITHVLISSTLLSLTEKARMLWSQIGQLPLARKLSLENSEVNWGAEKMVWKDLLAASDHTDFLDKVGFKLEEISLSSVHIWTKTRALRESCRAPTNLKAFRVRGVTEVIWLKGFIAPDLPRTRDALDPKKVYQRRGARRGAVLLFEVYEAIASLPNLEAFQCANSRYCKEVSCRFGRPLGSNERQKRRRIVSLSRGVRALPISKSLVQMMMRFLLADQSCIQNLFTHLRVSTIP